MDINSNVSGAIHYDNNCGFRLHEILMYPCRKTTMFSDCRLTARAAKKHIKRRFYPKQLLLRLQGKRTNSLSIKEHAVLSFFMKRSRIYGLTILVTHRVIIGKDRIIQVRNGDKLYREIYEPCSDARMFDMKGT